MGKPLNQPSTWGNRMLTRRGQFPERSNQTKSGPEALPGPDDITRVELPNGIVVLARANFNSPSIVVQGSLQAGALFEDDEHLGLAGFTAAGLMRGTTRRSFQEIYDAIESIGASLGFNAATHTTTFSGRSLSEDLPLLLSLISESLREPIFPADQIEKLRARLLTGLAIRAQDTGEMAAMAFDQIVYPGHPYSRPEDGYPETIQAISLDDLTDFHRRSYGPREMIITVVGGVDPQAAVDRIAAVLGDWDNPEQPTAQPLPALPEPANPLERKVTIPGKFQADLILGTAGPERRSPDWMAAVLGNSVLGQFGMMGRIGDAVREQAGLAYYAYSNVSAGLGPGPWSASAGVDPENVAQAVDLIRAEIERFVSELVSPEELSDSQANFIGRLPLSLESNGGVAAALLNLERYQLGLDYYWRYPDLVRAVTREEILEVARRYFDPQRLAVAIAGP